MSIEGTHPRANLAARAQHRGFPPVEVRTRCAAHTPLNWRVGSNPPVFSQQLTGFRRMTDPHSQDDMDDRLTRLNEKAKALPKAPGVYLMKDERGRVIYVGKSASLRDRVCSYFQPATQLDFKKAPLRDHVVDFEVIQTESEVEALLAENRLIKDIQPRFNARLLDDKTFPYLMITTGEEFPGVYVTREPRTEGVKLYGPLTSVYAPKEAVTLLQKARKFRTCHLDIR